MNLDKERLQRLLGGPGTERLRRRLRERLGRGGADTLTLTRSTPQERAAVERLVGRPPRSGSSLRVSLAEIDATLARAGIAPGLRAALEALDGPIRDAAAEEEAEARRWRNVFDGVRDRAARLGLESWLDELAARGLLKRVARRDPANATVLLEQGLAVLEALPDPGLNRSTLAARCLGDAHGLDPGQPVAALVRRALHRHWRGGTGGERPDARTLWAHAGILVGGDITSTVLVHQLPVQGDAAGSRALRIQNQCGEPGYLTLRQLLRHPPRWDCTDREIFVCENPTVVAEAAERLGVDCAPLVSTGGRPGAAVWLLLEQLRAAGALLHYRADFDWAGVSIMNSVLARFEARPWRMDIATLERHAQDPGPSLDGRPVAASWDSRLAPALEARGTALHEERLLDELLADLARKQDDLRSLCDNQERP
ncbi:MAG: TIGR02679 family protein [Thioalkalivibrio sp.]|nr:MAG: TIGR02679 family protein [Thioalkalivibrio sp.]